MIAALLKRGAAAAAAVALGVISASAQIQSPPGGCASANCVQSISTGYPPSGPITGPVTLTPSIPVHAKSANYTITVATDAGAWMTMTGANTFTLPAASSVPANTPLLAAIQNLDASATTTVAVSGSDKINGGTAGAGLTLAHGVTDTGWVSDGVSNWSVVIGGGSGGSVSVPGAAGSLLIANGSSGFGTSIVPGTGVATLLAANQNASGGIISPTPTRAGDILTWNGSASVYFPGNNSGTQYLTENASGVLAWAAGSGSTSPGGSSGQLQYNNGGSFGGLATGQLPGEPSNGTASAGNIGEIATANSSAVAINATAPTLITSVSLTAGSWWCDGNFEPTLTASPTYLRVYIGTSATPPTTQWLSGNQVFRNPSTSLYSQISVAISRIHFSFSTTTTVGIYSDNSSATGNSVAAQLNCTRDH